MVIVQEPAEALASDMPRNVLRHIQTDYCLPLAEIASLLVKLCVKGPKITRPRATTKDCQTVAAEKEVVQLVEPMNYSCPDCGGSLMKIKDGNLTQYRCHVGHIYSEESFSEAHSNALERALWVALQRLNEKRSIEESLAQRHGVSAQMKRRYQENADAVGEDMRLLHEVLARL